MFRRLLPPNFSLHVLFALCFLLSVIAAAPISFPAHNENPAPTSPAQPALPVSPIAPAPTALPVEATPVLPRLSSSPFAESLMTAEAALDVAANPVTTRVPILEYHYSTFHMGDDVIMTTEWFESQMQWLDDHEFATLSSKEFVAFLEGDFLPPARSVLLTFDVGYSHFDDYANVVIPALRRYQFHGVFFVLASKAQEECDGEHTCWPSLLAWRDEGLISIESHTLYHQDYTALTPEEIKWDAGRSKEIIETHTGEPVLGLCYPFDNPSPVAASILKDLGYRFTVGGATRAERSALFADPEPFNLPRYYPYSSADIYPAMIGMRGKTFGEMVMGAVVKP
jgi:peptidoglycan/xylan/chitin deacetylase (PgdA/CDA1 family)